MGEQRMLLPRQEDHGERGRGWRADRLGRGQRGPAGGRGCGGRLSGPFQFDSEGQHLRILDADGHVLCRFPIRLRRLCSTPDGRTLAGADSNHLYILRLEGYVESGK